MKLFARLFNKQCQVPGFIVPFGSSWYLIKIRPRLFVFAVKSVATKDAFIVSMPLVRLLWLIWPADALYLLTNVRKKASSWPFSFFFAFCARTSDIRESLIRAAFPAKHTYRREKKKIQCWNSTCARVSVSFAVSLFHIVNETYLPYSTRREKKERTFFESSMRTTRFLITQSARTPSQKFIFISREFCTRSSFPIFW